MDNYLYAHLADALIIISKADHYMVGIDNPKSYTPEDWDGAYQILVDRQNSTPEGEAQWEILDVALDLCEEYKKEITQVPHASRPSHSHSSPTR